MKIEEYKSALKKGEKELSALKSKNQDPYLPTLEDITSGVRIVSRKKLGVITVPTDRIVGTINEGRSNAFSKNFLPLLEPDTEFAVKWATLYESMEEEGLKDPVLAFEYLGNYYIQEGNKRVSVSKCMDIPYIEAEVTRMTPERTDDFDIQLNYEYIEFYEKSKINSIYFSKHGSFTQFAELVAKDKEVWDEDLCLDVLSLYNRFSKQFLLKKGEKLAINVSDALLVYVSLMGYDEIKDKTGDEISADITKLWKEFELEGEEKPIVVSTEPFTEKPGKIASLFKSNKNLKIAFVYLRNVEDSSWAYAHDLGRHYIEENVFKGNIETEAFYDVSAEDAESTLEELCEIGFDIIFDAAPQHNAACAKVAIEYPNVKILNCSLNASTKAMRTYYLRTYESKFLLGIIAGAMTKNDKISYICDYPVYGTVASINAFALGAKSVNPRAEIYLSWTSVKNMDDRNEIDDNECDVVSNLDWSSPKHLTRRFGVYLKSEIGDPINLAAPLWDWGKLYETIIKSVQVGSWKLEESTIGNLSLGYWWGLSSGAVDLIYSHNIPDGTKRLVEFLKHEIIKGNFKPYGTVLTYQDGSTEDFSNYKDVAVFTTMNKLLDNIHGYVPSLSDIKDEDKSLTKVQGVKGDL